MPGSGTNPQVTGPLSPGTVLQNRYQIERLLGGGGMGMVYLARDRRLANRACAMKEMVDHFIDQQQRIEANEYFAREADTLAQLKHQSIPAITDRFDDQNRHYLVMEYVEGRNLEEELAARGQPLPEGLVIDVARQLADVLSYLHGLTPPIIYRDMKPSNVMLTPKGRVVLVDFGIARLFKAARKGTMIGTLGFAPPEQYQGQVDPRSDIYSLGATLHYVLTGRDPEKFPPFSFPPVRELRPEVSSNLAGAIDAALTYNVGTRPASVIEFRDMMLYGRGLEAGAAGPRSGTAGLALTLPAELPETAIVHPRSRVARAIGFALFTIALAGGAFGATYLYSSPELQMQLGIKPLFDALPWKHEELLAKARENPLEFDHMTLALSTREGSPIAAPQASFTDTQITGARYLKWEATFKNNLLNLDGRDEKIDARFYDPGNMQIASSSADLFVGPKQPTADFSGVALMPPMTERPPGRYKVTLSLGDKPLAEESFVVNQDLSAKTKAAAAAAAEAASARAEEERRKQEAQRLAMIEERQRKPLDLRSLELLNTNKRGTPLGASSSTFDFNTLKFVEWQLTFDNRLYKLQPMQYRVDAVYNFPSGESYGVDDWQTVSQNQKTVTFSGRVGNAAGGAFQPGTYTINFLLNGQYIKQKRFIVVASAGASGYIGGGIGSSSSSSSSSSSGSSGLSLSGPTIVAGQISGLPGGSAELELRLRPQANGFLHGEIQIRSPSFGTEPIEGFVRGNEVAFSATFGIETYTFEGHFGADRLSGTYLSNPSNLSGKWTAQSSP